MSLDSRTVLGLALDDAMCTGSLFTSDGAGPVTPYDSMHSTDSLNLTY